MDANYDGHHIFAQRVARINAAASSAKQLLFVGVDEVYSVPIKPRQVAASPIRALLGNLMYPVSLVMAVAVGVVSHGIGMVIRYQVQGLPDLNGNPDIEMVEQIVLGFSIAMVLGYVLGLRSNSLTSLKSAGAALGVLFFHNAVHMFPQVFAMLTSELWVNQMITHTHPHSILWRGISFML